MNDDEKKEHMIAALAKAGQKVNANWKDSTILSRFLALEQLEPHGNPPEANDPEPSTFTNNTVSDMAINMAAGGHNPAMSMDHPNFLDDYLKVLAMADPKMGDKDPTVIEFCRKYLAPAEFEKKYHERTGYNVTGEEPPEDTVHGAGGKA